MLCIVAISDCTHVGSATHLSSRVALQENTTADILAEDQLRPPLDMGTW